ncbi:MAG: hypothetical protein B6D74_18500, partial [gamma proteobacterium symbiont of Ctena orbiculata]
MINKTLVKAISGCLLLLVSSQALSGDDRHEKEERESKDKGSFSFAMIGDVPYGVAPYADYPPFDNLIDEINKRKKLKWVIHTGDIKSGGSNCSDALFYDRLERYNKFSKPFI